ncbi:cAMP-independent regulatory protein pac2 [Grifola frondosa]|uniref:cAMP-independent regulatory protein pac2 n=1 Tax=Grifola frondosa TaxID=5627 RepID=A0A1C7MKJ6_GRIFR|nr:cAMP-independent regulatory protein pac2 [Grifola frondosa]
MQHPTLKNVRIRSTRDALQIFYAVARNVLPMISRRLDAEERRAITSGDVYVWEERCANSEATGMGMERWTDGMGWGPSRVRDEFLFYHQRETDSNDDPSNPSARWANMMRRREARPGSLPFSRSDAERLIKQTYSVHVALPDDRSRGVTRKWHLTAYFSQTTLDSLGTIDAIPGVGSVLVPDGWFKSARASKAKRADAPSDDMSTSPQDPWGLGLRPSSSRGMSQFQIDPPPAPADQFQHSPPSSKLPFVMYSLHQAHFPIQQNSPMPAGHTSIPGPSPQSSISLPGRLPTLADTGLSLYRDSSPFTQSSSSSSSDPDLSPQIGPRELVPLAYLQGLTQPLRDPVDEFFLRRLSTSDISKVSNPQTRPAWSDSHGQFARYVGEDSKVRAMKWTTKYCQHSYEDDPPFCRQ